MSDLENLWREHGDAGLLVFGLNGGDPADQLAAFLEQTGITFPVIDARGTAGLFNYPPGVGYPYPRDIVIGKDGTVRSIRTSFNAAEMTELVEDLLAEPD